MAQAFHDSATPIRAGSRRATVLLSVGLVVNLAPLMTFAATLNEIAVDWSPQCHPIGVDRRHLLCWLRDGGSVLEQRHGSH